MAVRLVALLLLVGLALGSGCAKAPALHPNTSGWWRDRTFYEIFVRSFADSDGDGVGDLKGVTAHLDDLNDGDPSTKTDLGVDAIWLMPIFPSPSYHGYDVSDYRAVNPSYGTLEDFDALVKGAHRRGIKVILDMVLNHSSTWHPWFVDSMSKGSARRDWYLWRDTDPGWTQPWGGSGRTWHSLGGSYFYGLFCSCMPDLNLANPAVEAELVDTMKLWLSRGADGFRLDAARYFIESPTGGLADQPETHAFLRRIRGALQASYPDALLVAEAWASVETQDSYYGQGDEVQLAFSFDLADAIKASAASGDASAVTNLLARSESALAGKDRGFEAPFLSNHDQERVLRALGGDAGAMRVAAALLFALPGTPFIYYGEEIGMQGGAGGGDENKRTPMRWTASGAAHGFSTGSAWNDAAELPGVDVATQRADPASLWNEYRRLLALRHAERALATGDAGRVTVQGGGAGALALLRSAAGQRVLFVANFAAAATGAFDLDFATGATPLESEGLTAAPTVQAGKLHFAGLAPHGFAYLSLN